MCPQRGLAAIRRQKVIIGESPATDSPKTKITAHKPPLGKHRLPGQLDHVRADVLVLKPRSRVPEVRVH